MSQIEVAVTLSRKLESLLEQKHQAVGKGLHEKVTSVEAKLPEALVKQLRYIATMRNSVVHEEGFAIPDLAQFTAVGEAAVVQLGGAVTTVTAAQTPEEVSNTEIAVIAALVIFGGGIGVIKLGFWPGILGAVGGLCIGGLVTSDEAKKFYKSAAEFVLGLFILACVWILGSAIYKWMA